MTAARSDRRWQADESALCEHELERVFAAARVRRLFSGRWTAGAVVKFHAAHKLLLLAHSPAAYHALGRLVARVRDVERGDFPELYTEPFLAAMAIAVPRSRHVNVLQHMAGYFSDRLDRERLAELHTAIEEYRQGLAPRILAVTLLRHHIGACGLQYLANQAYLEPYPPALMPDASRTEDGLARLSGAWPPFSA